MDRQVVLQALRIPALLAVLVLLGSALRTFQASFMRIEMPTAGWAWAVIATAVLAFVAVALIGRATQHPPVILAVEAVVASLLGLIPPTLWIIWVGLGGLPMVFGLVTGSVVVPVLALTWLTIVACTGVRQWRAPRERAPVGVAPESNRAG